MFLSKLKPTYRTKTEATRKAMDHMFDLDESWWWTSIATNLNYPPIAPELVLRRLARTIDRQSESPINEQLSGRKGTGEKVQPNGQILIGSVYTQCIKSEGIQHTFFKAAAGECHPRNKTLIWSRQVGKRLHYRLLFVFCVRFNRLDIVSCQLVVSYNRSFKTTLGPPDVSNVPSRA